MTALIAALLILVPSPKAAPKPVEAHPAIGARAIDWGQTLQTTFFYEDGTCWSPEFSSGTWVSVDDSIWFTEQGGRMQYVMRIDPFTGLGTGWHVDSEGVPGNAVEVKMRKGERLPMPREVK